MARFQGRDLRRTRRARPGNPCWDSDPMVVQIGSGFELARSESDFLCFLSDHKTLLRFNL